MNPEAPFLETIRAHPDDVATRLVYADWLEERGDLRAYCLKAEIEAIEGGRDSREAFDELAKDLDPVWVARVSRPPFGICCSRVRFTDCDPQLTEADLDMIAQRLGVALPLEFRAFLLNYNGGQPEPRWLPDHNRDPYGPLSLEINGGFFKAYVPEKPSGEPAYYGIESNLRFMKALHEEGPGPFLIVDMIPFASTQHDLGYLLLGTETQNLGHVFHFTDYCHNTGDPEHLTEYARTFSGFLNSFISDPEPYE